MENEQITFDTVQKTEAEQLRDVIQKCIGDKDRYYKLIEVIQNKTYIAVKAKHLLAAKVDAKKSGVRIEYRSIYDEKFAEFAITHLNGGISRIVVPCFNDVLAIAPVLSEVAVSEVTVAGDEFGCCGRYEACSDARKCIHPDQLFAAACAYKKNLEQGRIFYGKNKNT